MKNNEKWKVIILSKKWKWKSNENSNENSKIMKSNINEN
jgi:hypothetical protein